MVAETQNKAAVQDWIPRQCPYWVSDADMDKKRELFRRITETEVAEQDQDFGEDEAFDVNEKVDHFTHILLRRLQDIAVFCPESNDAAQALATFLSGVQIVGCYQNVLDNHLSDMPWGEWCMRHITYLDKIGFVSRMEQHLKDNQPFDRWAALLPEVY